MKKVIVIPARLQSTRLPNKLLLDLGGKSILQRVYEQCNKVKDIYKVLIATDSEIILKHAKDFTNDCLLTNENHNSGTDRIAEAVADIECNVVINVQGDEPFIDPDLIAEIGNQFKNTNVQMASAKCKITSVKELHDPNNVKVVTDRDNNAIYFSRSCIPFNREEFAEGSDIVNKNFNYYKHLGIYGYTKDFLIQYSKMKPTYLETTEKLEQLRVLENGYSIKMVETSHNAIGIDTLEDYEKAKQLIEQI